MDGPLIGVVLLYWEIAPQMTTRAAVEKEQRGVENLAADVIEIDVDALGAVLRQGCLHVFRLVVDAGIKAKFVYDVIALRGAAGNADHTAAFDLGDLTGNRADGAGRAREDHRLARLCLTNLEQAEVGSESGHPEGAEIARKGRELNVDLHHALAARDRKFLHAEDTGDVVADREGRISGCDHPACSERTHDLTDFHRGDI